MKILLIGHEADLNGASKSLLSIAKELIRRGNQVIVLSSYSSGAFFEELSNNNIRTVTEPFERWCVYKKNSDISIKSQMIDIFRWKKINRINKETAKIIASLASEENIDVIHSNTSVINVGALISKYSEIPHVWHIREFGDLDFNMYPLIPHFLYYSIMNRYTDRFICISKAIYDYYRKLSRHKKKVIYNGIEQIFYINISNETSDIGEPIRILLAGRISVAKGQQEAVDACDLLWRKGIYNFVLFLAGSQDMSICIPSYLKKNIIELGSISNMVELRKSVDIGIPVIGSNTGGTPELIEDGVTGLLYEKGNIQQLADKMQYLIEHADVRRDMGKAAQEYALSHFTIDRCVDEIEAIYREVLEQRSAAKKKL